MIARFVLSFIVVMLWGWFNTGAYTATRIVVGQTAGLQFEPSNTALFQYDMIQRLFAADGIHTIASLLAVILLIVIWLKPIKSLVLPLVAVGFLVAVPHGAKAYYNQSDYTESYYVLPNETAFWVPDVGDNKSTQAKLDSEDYYKANKVASKLINIPHVKLPGSGLWANYYVPAGRLLIVERTPVTRHWVDATDRGTAKSKEGLVCQSKEGLDITVGVAIGVNIMPDEASKYLYNFGIAALAGNHTDPNVLFTSVLFARSLSTVTDTVLKTRIHALACNELAQRSLEEDNQKAKEVMDHVVTEATKFAASVGITIEFLGWADTFQFDTKVQDALNEKFKLEKLREVLDVQTKLAANETMLKWNGSVPQTVSGLWLLPSEIWQSVTGWLSGKSNKGS